MDVSFAKKQCLKMYRLLHEEASSTDLDAIQVDMDRVISIIEKYDKKDIFNFDEIAIFYTAPPRTTIAQQGFAGWKQEKCRTAGLLGNSDGSIR